MVKFSTKSYEMDRLKAMLCIFVVLQSLFLTTTVIEYEYDNHIVSGGNSTASKLDLGFLTDEKHQVITKSGLDIPITADTVFKGSIVFMNGNKMVRCSPMFSLSTIDRTLIRLSFGCTDESPTIQYTFWLDFMVAAAKTICILLFVYTIILWNYLYMIDCPFQLNRGVQSVAKAMKLNKGTAHVEINMNALDFLKR